MWTGWTNVRSGQTRTTPFQGDQPVAPTYIQYQLPTLNLPRNPNSTPVTISDQIEILDYKLFLGYAKSFKLRHQ